MDTMNGPAAAIIIFGIIAAVWLWFGAKPREEVSTDSPAKENGGGGPGTRPRAVTRVPITGLPALIAQPGFELRLDDALARVVAHPEDADDVAHEVRTMLEHGTDEGETLAIEACFDVLVAIAQARVFRARFQRIGGGLNAMG